MQHYIRVRDQIMWIRAQVAFDTRVFLQHRGLLFAFSATFASTPNIISQIMLTHYLHHSTRPGLLNEGFRFQHVDDKSLKRLDSGVLILPFDEKQTVSYPCVNLIYGPTKHSQSFKTHAKSDFRSSFSKSYFSFMLISI